MLHTAAVLLARLSVTGGALELLACFPHSSVVYLPFCKLRFPLPEYSSSSGCR